MTWFELWLAIAKRAWCYHVGFLKMITNVISTNFGELIEAVVPFLNMFFFYAVGVLLAVFAVGAYLRGLKGGAG